jgi:DNA-binding LacI/PurR family transcriptional regulator
MFQWLRLQHIDIPSRMALISFDNSRLVHPLPITSVDFGFGDLGYAAFHALMGDIPVDIGRGRRRPARAFVVHRGSL